MDRERLPKQLEVISKILQNENVTDLIGTFKPGMNTAQMNAIIIGILAEMIKANKEEMDALAELHSGKSREEVEKLTDKEYATILREAIVSEVLGFFG